jgi:hypothetical protein
VLRALISLIAAIALSSANSTRARVKPEGSGTGLTPGLKRSENSFAIAKFGSIVIIGSTIPEKPPVPPVELPEIVTSTSDKRFDSRLKDLEPENDEDALPHAATSGPVPEHA